MLGTGVASTDPEQVKITDECDLGAQRQRGPLGSKSNPAESESVLGGREGVVIFWSFKFFKTLFSYYKNNSACALFKK